MDKPVRVGLVFPRSGQQLYVQVPSHWAQGAQWGMHKEAVVRAENGQRSNNTGSREEHGRQE